MSVANLTFNGVSVLDGQPVPFLGKSVDYIQAGERLVEQENWTLDGLLTGCDLDDILYAQNYLLSGISGAFGEISIAGLSFPIVEVKGVSFGETDGIGSIPYSIQFSDYGYWSGSSGILSPKDEFSYSQEDDGTISLTRTISANGVLCSGLDYNDPLDSVRTFILNRSGFYAPFIISGATNLKFSDFQLVSSEETVDRLSNSISLTQSFKSDPSGIAGSDKSIIHRYSIQITENILDSSVDVSINGDISAGRYHISGITGARQAYTRFKTSYPTGFFTSESVNEDDFTNKLNYTFSFKSGTGFPENIALVEDDFSITLRESSNSSLFDVSVQGNAISPYGCIEARYDRLSSGISGFHFDLVTQLYEEFYARGATGQPDNVILNPFPLSTELTFDEFNASLSYSASYNDRFVPPDIGKSGDFEASVSVTLPIDLYSVSEHYLGGQYIKQKLNVITREVVGVEASIRGESGSLSGYGASVVSIWVMGGTEQSYDSPSRLSANDQLLEYTYSETRSVKKEEDKFVL